MSDVGPEEGWCQVADTLIVADRVVPATGADIFMPGFVRISRGTVAEVARGRPAGTADLELTDGVLVPGFVDLQVNGHFGVDLAAVDPAGWASVVARLPETGTTAFLPTFITAPVHKLAAALRATREFGPGLPLAPVYSAFMWKGRSFRYAAGVPTIPSGSLNRSPRRSASCSTPAAGCCGSSHSLPNGPGPSLP